MKKISVSVAFALKEKQWIRELSLFRGATAREAIKESGLLQEVPSLRNTSLDKLDLGVFAHKVDVEYLLEEGDRLEIYRPLTADPKEVRRQLALLGKTMGKN